MLLWVLYRRMYVTQCNPSYVIQYLKRNCKGLKTHASVRVELRPSTSLTIGVILLKCSLFLDFLLITLSSIKYLVYEYDNHVYKMPHQERFYKNTVNDDSKIQFVSDLLTQIIYTSVTCTVNSESTRSIRAVNRKYTWRSARGHVSLAKRPCMVIIFGTSLPYRTYMYLWDNLAILDWLLRPRYIFLKRLCSTTFNPPNLSDERRKVALGKRIWHFYIYQTCW